jgi:hypothetical protein
MRRVAMFWLHAELQTHHDKLEEFKRICSKTFDHLAQHGMHLYGAWETVVGPRHLVVDMWRFETEQAMLHAFASLLGVPQFQEFGRDVPSILVTEDLKSINPMLYCLEFRTLKTQAILYWQMRTKRECFQDWVAMRSQFVLMAEERGWVLAAAWTNAFTAGPLNECTEVWYFSDQTKLLEAMARVEQDEKIQELLAQAGALLIKDSSRLMRPIWYSPDYLP